LIDFQIIPLTPLNGWIFKKGNDTNWAKPEVDTTAIRTYNRRCLKRIRIRQCKYLNNRVEQDHRFIKWRIQNTLGFKSFESASRTLTGIEIVRMIKKQQVTFSRIT
jgi:putative transposase